MIYGIMYMFLFFPDYIDSCKYNYHMIMATMAPCLGTDYIDSCKYNYHMIMATMAPCLSCVKHSYPQPWGALDYSLCLLIG
jgi:hypothetical protein